MKTTSLEEILASKPAASEEEGVVVAVPEADNGESAEDASSETAADETPAENAAESGESNDDLTVKEGDSKEVKGLKAALLAERNKRQKLEAQLQEKGSSDSSDTPAEEGGGGEGMDEQEYMKKIDGQENLMRDMHDDYDAAMEHFYELIDGDKTGELQQQLNAAKSPVVFAYKTGKDHWNGKIEAQKTADAQKEEELRARIKKELEDEMKQKNKPKPAKTLPDGGSSIVEVADAPKSLTDILGR